MQSIGGNAPDFTREYLFVRSGPETDESLASMRAEAADSFEATLVSHTQAMAALSADRTLTPEGQRERAQEYSTKAVQEIVGQWTPRIRQLEAAIEKGGAILSAAMRHRVPEGHDVNDWRPIEAEVRARASAMQPAEVHALYLEACRSNDTLTVRALEQAPPSFRLLTEDMLAEGAALHAEARTPDAFRLLEEQSAILTSLKGDLKRVCRDLGKVADVPVAGAA
jgi:hypothetical protein